MLYTTKALMRLRRRPARRASARCGAAVVEFALVAPIFFMLVIGIIEVGRAMMVEQLLVNASRVGARRAVMLTSTQQAVLDAVEDYMDGVMVQGVTATVSPDPASAAAPRRPSGGRSGRRAPRRRASATPSRWSTTSP